MNKEKAIQQIRDIHGIIEGNLKAIIPGKLMIAIGACITAIPGIEYFLNHYIDPALSSLIPINNAFIFIVRTIFYWSFFLGISYAFNQEKTPKNAFVEKVFNVGRVFPIIPILTAAMLATSGYSDLISPFVLILVGCLLALYGEFSSRIVSAIAWSNIGVGIYGIKASTYAIDNLWIYLVWFQGISLIIMGIALWYTQHKNQP